MHPANSHNKRDTSGPAFGSGLNAETLFADYAERIYHFSLRLCGGNTADAEDLTQDVLLSALRARESFQGRSAVLTYLYRIAINRSQRIRSRSEASARREQTALIGTSSDPSEQAVTRVELERALAALPEDLRVAFLIVKSEELTYREAAQILEIPQGTLQSRVHDATLRLRALLREASVPASLSGGRETPNDVLKESCHAL